MRIQEDKIQLFLLRLYAKPFFLRSIPVFLFMRIFFTPQRKYAPTINAYKNPPNESESEQQARTHKAREQARTHTAKEQARTHKQRSRRAEQTSKGAGEQNTQAKEQGREHTRQRSKRENTR
jgi:hypothetical protein